jgi:outer membrane protein OmpA-like peptidoglycan-associated protein
MKRVEIDPKTIEGTKPEKKKDMVRPEISVPEERPNLQDVASVAVSTPEMIPPNTIGPRERPMDDATTALTDNFSKNPGNEGSLTSGIDEAGKTDAPISLPEPKGPEDGGSGVREIISGSGEKFSNLDELLAGTGKVTPQTAPILMPTDLLFEYNSATLKGDAEHSLAKLGYLIKKNKEAVFKIEGHTDSFGSDEYNDQLSLKRAEAVKAWLLQHAGLEEKNMTTAGLGKRHLLVSATGSVAQQQLNRRVEIVISTR